MSVADESGENEAGTSSGSRPIVEHAREIRRDASALAEDLRGTRQEIETVLGQELTQRPLRAVGIALGVGYVLGGGLTTRLTYSMFGAATRLTTMLMLGREFYELSRRWQEDQQEGGQQGQQQRGGRTATRGEQSSQYSGTGGGSTMGAGSYQGSTTTDPSRSAGGSRERERQEDFRGGKPPSETHH